MIGLCMSTCIFVECVVGYEPGEGMDGLISFIDIFRISYIHLCIPVRHIYLGYISHT